MKYLKIVWACSMAAFALSAIASTQAFAALPEFAPAGGKFPVNFTSTSGAGTLETLGGTKISCTSDSNSGQITGPKEDTATVIFKGCTTKVLFTLNCTTPGKAAGEIETKELSSTLGYAKGTKVVSILLVPKAGTIFAEFECSTFGKVKVGGGVVAPVSPINTKSTSFTLGYKLTPPTKGMQQYTGLEGITKNQVLETTVNGGTAEESGIETTDVLTPAETGEIKG